jgi:hypothetical protein
MMGGAGGRGTGALVDGTPTIWGVSENSSGKQLIRIAISATGVTILSAMTGKGPFGEQKFSRAVSLYEKRAKNFLAMVQMAPIHLWLRI